METQDSVEALAARLAARGVVLLELAGGEIAAECRACRVRWPIPTERVGGPDDAVADWWWCPNGCNREE
jgi:hypothetical protein